MTKNAIFEVPKIPKPIKKYKVGRSERWRPPFEALKMLRLALNVLCSKDFLVLLTLYGTPAVALPVAIAWDVPIRQGERLTLEIARDPGFADIALTAAVQGRDFGWEAPHEGIYHWRLLRPVPLSTDGTSRERSTFISGSFAVIDSQIARQATARLSWDPIEGTDRYKLYVLEDQGRRRSMITTAAAFFVSRTDRTQMVAVVPFVKGKPTLLNYHFNPTLRFESGNTPQAQGAVAASLPSPEIAPLTGTPPSVVVAPLPSPLPEIAESATLAPKPAPVVTPLTAQDTDAPVAPPGHSSALSPPTDRAAEVPAPEPEAPANAAMISEKASSPAARRRHLVEVFGLFVEEELHAQKLDIDLTSQQKCVGGGASFWTNPVSGLLISGAAFYHEHAASLSQATVAEEERFDMRAARYTADLGVGWNLLTGLTSEPYLLGLSFGAAFAQLPLLPLEFSSATGAAPRLDAEAISLLGGGLSFGYLGGLGGFVLDGGVFANERDASKLSFVRLSSEFYVNSWLALGLGLYQRRSEVKRCHTDAVICDREGDVRTTAAELGFLLSLGLVRF